MSRRAVIVAVLLGVLPVRAGHAFTIASESFGYTVGAALDGQGGGFGWDTGPFVQGTMSGSCGSATPITYGHSGATWVTSSTYGASSHNRIGSGSLAYPGVASAGNMLVEVDGTQHSGNSGLRAFRTVLTSAPGLAAYVAGGNLAQGTIYLAFLARVDPVTCGGTTPCAAPSCSAAASRDGGMHLFQGFGNLTTCSDGPKHPYEHLFVVDQNHASNWSVARTTGGGTGAWTAITSVPFDDTTHFYVLRIDFDTNQACAATSTDLSNCPATPNAFPSIATNCGGATAGNETITVAIDPDLTPPLAFGGAALAKIGPASVYDFVFDTIEVGAEGETVDLDELRIGTRFDDVVDDHPYCASDADCASDPQGRTHCDTTVGTNACVASGGSTSTIPSTTTTTTVTTTVTSTSASTTSVTAASSTTTTSGVTTTTTAAGSSSTTSTTMPVPCAQGGTPCDDGNPCTVDTCDTVAGRCDFAHVAGFDGIACECGVMATACAGVRSGRGAIRQAKHGCAIAAHAGTVTSPSLQTRLLGRAARRFTAASVRTMRALPTSPCLAAFPDELGWVEAECLRLAGGG